MLPPPQGTWSDPAPPGVPGEGLRETVDLLQISAFARGLTIDDISLPHGGLIDETGVWIAPQCYHQHGLSVDLVADYGPYTRWVYGWLKSWPGLDTEGFQQNPTVRKHFLLWKHAAYQDSSERWHLEFSSSDVGAQ